jgi:AraC family transcriptional regulator
MSGPASLQPGTFFGVSPRSSRQEGFLLSETFYRPSQKVPRHVHQLPYFCLLVEGRYWEQYRGKPVEMGPRSVVFHPAGEVYHGDIGGNGARCFHLEIEETWQERLRALGGLPGETVSRPGGELSWLAARAFREFRSPDGFSALALEGLALELVAVVGREGLPAERRPPEWLLGCAEGIRDDLRRSFSVSGLAAELGVSPTRLSREFRRHFGMSVGEYARRARVDYVSERLGDTDVELAALALEAGFADQSHLNRVFKRVTGSTPGQARRERRGGTEY